MSEGGSAATETSWSPSTPMDHCQLCGTRSDEREALLGHIKECSDKQLKITFQANRCLMCGDAFLSKELLLFHITKCSTAQLEILQQLKPPRQLVEQQPSNNVASPENSIKDEDEDAEPLMNVETQMSSPDDDVDNSNSNSNLEHGTIDVEEHIPRISGEDDEDENESVMNDKAKEGAKLPSLQEMNLAMKVKRAVEKAKAGHLATFNKDKPHVCPACGKGFPEKRRLTKHFDVVHLGRKDFQCNSCGKFFSEKGKLKKHRFAMHLGEKPVLKAETLAALGNHDNDCDIEHDDGDGDAETSLDDKILAQAARVARAKSLIQARVTYMDEAAALPDDGDAQDDGDAPDEPADDDDEEAMLVGGGPASPLAEEEPVTSADSAGLADNRDGDATDATQPPQPPHACADCGKTFVEARRLKRHVDTVHLRLRDHKCNSCDKSFGEKSGLKKHIMAVHREQVHNYSWPSEIIQAQEQLQLEDVGHQIKEEEEDDVKNNEVWRDGINQGTEEKPHLCTLCGKCFSRITALKDHNESIHEGRKAYQCSQCSMTFSVAPKLKRHIEAIHQKKRDHKCDQCDKSFTQSWVLKNHIEAIHEKQRFKCYACEKSFSRGSALKSHVEIDHEGKMKKHFCNICGKTLNRADDFRKHLSTVHNLAEDVIVELTEKD